MSDVPVCDRCGLPIIGVLERCGRCEDARDTVYDAAMQWVEEFEALFGGMTFEELEKDMTPCMRTLYLACRRAKEGR